MGTVQFGAPAPCVNFLRDALGLTMFVEGGTYRGGTARWASERFDRVVTIENSPEMHAIATRNLQGISNVDLRLGDSRQHLTEVCRHGDHVLYWLDAHWSGGVTYGAGDECPLLDELRIIFAAHQNCAILIDDARLFLAPPPRPHQRSQWPTLVDLVNDIPAGWDCLCHDDVLSIIPDHVSDSYRDFMQSLISPTASEDHKPKRSLVAKLFSRRAA